MSDQTRDLWDSLKSGDTRAVMAEMLRPVPVFIDPTLSMIDVARALATQGMCFGNDHHGNLTIIRLQGYEPVVKPIEPTQEQVDSDLFDGAWDGSGEGEPLPRSEED